MSKLYLITLLARIDVRNVKVLTDCLLKWKTEHPVLKQTLLKIKPRRHRSNVLGYRLDDDHFSRTLMCCQC